MWPQALEQSAFVEGDEDDNKAVVTKQASDQLSTWSFFGRDSRHHIYTSTETRRMRTIPTTGSAEDDKLHHFASLRYVIALKFFFQGGKRQGTSL